MNDYVFHISKYNLNKKNYVFYKYLSFSLIIISLSIFLLFINIINQLKNKNKQKNKSINILSKYIPKLPETIEEHNIKKDYHKTYYDINNIRYHFEDIFDKRKLFLINYDYYPYQEIKKNLTFDQNANLIFQSTGMLNITKLEFYYYNIQRNLENFNQIHISMAFDVNFILLSTISIVSILNTSNSDTFTHFHIILNNCTYYDIKPIIDLKRINNNVSFIFYNGKQAEYDFKDINLGDRGIGEYSRLLIPEIVNNTNKILILDSGDLFANKDLSEIFFFELKDNYFAFSLEDVAGRIYKDFYLFRHKFYSNGGVTLVNIRKFREDNLYKTAFYTSMAFSYFECPYQDILILISNFKFKYFPLNYNCRQFYKSKTEFINNNFTSYEINYWLDSQKFSPFRYSKKELVNAALNPVILHLYKSKPFKNHSNEEFKKMWINYAKMTNLFDKIKEKYPFPFKNY